MSTPPGPMNSADVMSEGFKPLLRTPTEPKNLGKPSAPKSISFKAQETEPEALQDLWDNSTWGQLQKSRGKHMDRANSFIGSKEKVDNDGLIGAIAVVDPCSTGAHIAAAVCKA
eukprot:gene54273-72528_t